MALLCHNSRHEVLSCPTCKAMRSINHELELIKLLSYMGELTVTNIVTDIDIPIMGVVKAAVVEGLGWSFL